MKRLIWSASMVLALVSAPNIRATQVKGVTISVTGGETLSSAQVTTAQEAITKSAQPTSSTAQKTTATSTSGKTVVVTPTLSPVVSQNEKSGSPTGTTQVSSDGYVPESLVSKFNPETPSSKKPTAPTTPTKTNPTTPAVVPDRTATAGLFGIAFLGTVAMKKKFKA